MRMNRIVLGLAAMAVFGLVAGELVSRANIAIDPALRSLVVGLVAAAIGAFIARRGFVLPALGLCLAEWLLVIYALYRIAEPVAQASVLAIAQLNLPIFLRSAAVVALGALLGQAFARRSQRAKPAI